MADALKPETARPEALFFLATSGWIPACLHVVARLGVASLLADGPRSADELSVTLDVHPGALERVLRALSTVGIFEQHGDAGFGLTPLGQYLRPDVPGSMHAAILAYNAQWRAAAWDRLLEGVRIGENAFLLAMGQTLFQYLAQDPEAAATFDRGQSSVVALTATAITEAYDFSSFRCVVDVAGGQGRLLTTVLMANPRLEGVLFDLPHVIAQARRAGVPGQHGLEDRVRYVAGDALEFLPVGGDVYIFQRIIHGFNDACAHTILRNCHRAAAPGGRLLIVEALAQSGTDGKVAAFFDLEMMVVAGGRIRSEAELRALLEGAGFELTRVIPTATSFSIVEALRR